MASDLSNAIRRLRREGYDITLGRGGHWQVRRDGRLVTVLSASTRNRRLLDNVHTQTRQPGVSA